MRLTKKKKLQLYNSINKKSIVVEEYSTLEYISHECSYNEFYRTHTYRLNCNFQDSLVVITCSKSKEEEDKTVNCVYENLFKVKRYFWNEVFKENFPE